MPKVFFVQKPGRSEFDMGNINEFGEVAFLLRSNDAPSLNPGRALALIRDRISDWTPDDYLVAFGGDPFGIFLTGMVMADQFPGQPVRWLRWNRERDDDGRRTFNRGFYQPLRFSLSGRRLEEEVI